MKTKTWAAFGSLVINLMLGLVIAAVFSAAPLARADQARTCAAHAAAAHARPAPAQPAPPAPTRRSYVVAARMGWAMG